MKIKLLCALLLIVNLVNAQMYNAYPPYGIIGFIPGIVFDPTQCGTANTTNFKAHIHLSNTVLKDNAHGGHVHYSTGADIFFCSNANGSGAITFELVSYDNVNGIIDAWENVSTLSVSVNTTTYISYGNPANSISLSNPVALWASADGWLRRYHLVSNANDATGNSNGTPTSITYVSTAGYVTNTASLNGSTSKILASDASLPTGTFTMSGWFDFTATPSTNAIMAYGTNSSGKLSEFGALTATGNQVFWSPNGAGTFFGGTLSTNTLHYAMVNILAGNCNIYLDGSASPIASSSSTFTVVLNGVLSLGCNVNSAQLWQGYLGDLSVRSGTETTSQFTAEYKNGSNCGNVGTTGTFYTVTGTP